MTYDDHDPTCECGYCYSCNFREAERSHHEPISKKSKSSIVTLLTLPEAAEFLRVSRSTIYRLTAAGRLKVVRVGRQLRYRQADLDQLDAAEPTPKVDAPRPRGTTIYPRQAKPEASQGLIRQCAADVRRERRTHVG